MAKNTTTPFNIFGTSTKPKVSPTNVFQPRAESTGIQQGPQLQAGTAPYTSTKTQGPVQPKAPTAPISLAQQAVNKGYVSSIDEYNRAENAGRTLATPLPDVSVIRPDTLKRGSQITPPEVPPPPTNTRTMANADAPSTVPAPEETKPLTLKEQTQKYLIDQMSGSGDLDTSKLRKDNLIAEKQKRATDLYNQQLTIKARYEAQIEELEKNSQGVFAGALKQQVNDLSQKANKDLANISLQYKIANDDYVGAEKVVQDQIADMKDQRNYRLQVFNASMGALQNDLTDSEKMELQQKYDLEQIDYENEINSIETQGKNAVLDAQAQNYQSLLDTGQIALKDVPKDIMGYINTQGYVSPEQKASLDKSKSLLTNINSFLGTGGTTAVGAPIQRAFGATAGFFGVGTYAERKAQVENIQSLLTLDNLKLMTGVLTDRDIELLQRAASTLSPNMSESAYRKKLGEIGTSIESKLVASPAVPFEEKVTILSTKLKRDYPKATDDEIADLIDEQLPDQTSFNSAGNASVSSLSNAIKTVESGGDYQARGPVVTTGQYKGERALGAYQVMPGNLPSWSKEALGYVVTPEQFLANPQIQDQIAQSRFENLLKSNSPEDAAAIWFSGRPLAKNNSKDVTGTDTRTYVNRVISNLRA